MEELIHTFKNHLKLLISTILAPIRLLKLQRWNKKNMRSLLAPIITSFIFSEVRMEKKARYYLKLKNIISLRINGFCYQKCLKKEHFLKQFWLQTIKYCWLEALIAFINLSLESTCNLFSMQIWPRDRRFFNLWRQFTSNIGNKVYWIY